ncbi:hypothetical protein NLG97_g6058 [Lecanicillium saksenae]|uniref:Uncharacterized protein n=1 Tax=Lecanicillium saksenae TaxID=468837 RepID=A0ACC1QTX0_9HYPO|nr:hypothetical protein NLG97_g6058 [Lecanicillium saksenae]
MEMMKKLVLVGTAAALAGSTQAAAVAAAPDVWQPPVGEAWQIVIRAPLDMSRKLEPDVAIWDIDLFDNPASTIKQLHDGGSKVICYFSAGSFEKWRPDNTSFPEEDIGNPLEDWEKEWYVNVRSQAIRDVMVNRIQLAKDKGCDAIDPDNVDLYDADNGFEIKPEEAAEYLNFLAKAASDRGMSTGLKNAPGIVSSVIDNTHFVVNEECANPDNANCADYKPYIAADKPVFQIQYPNGVPDIDPEIIRGNCSHQGSAEGSEKFSIVFKDDMLRGFVEYCDFSKYSTPVLEDTPKGN